MHSSAGPLDPWTKSPDLADVFFLSLLKASYHVFQPGVPQQCTCEKQKVRLLHPSKSSRVDFIFLILSPELKAI